LQPAYNWGYEITRVAASIERTEYSESMNLNIDSTNASGTFSELSPGVYTITVGAFQDTLLVASGSGSAEVIAGQNTVVNISLQLVSGALTIVVDWGDTILGPPHRVLLVGNSHTYYNGGINTHLMGMLHASHPDWVVSASTAGGYSLKDHWRRAVTMNAIRTGDWDLVILQESSRVPVDQPDSFYTYSRKLRATIDSTGAETGFYMTHGWLNYPGMIDTLSAAYTQIGTELNALVCPAGLAWQRWRDLDPQVSLFASDNYHPNPLGTYLSTCVIYASIWHRSPVGNGYFPSSNIAEADRIEAQQIAWQTVCEYFGWGN
jgi:hypothetical protein